MNRQTEFCLHDSYGNIERDLLFSRQRLFSVYACPSPRAIENALASRTPRSFGADPSRLEDENAAKDSREEEEEELVGRDEYEGIDSGIDEEEQEEEEEDDEGGACQLVTCREVRVT